MRTGIGETEVGRVVGHGMLLAGDVHLGSANGEVAVGRNGGGEGDDRVLLLLCLCGIQSLGQKHVGVERIVLGLDDVLAVAVVHGH